MTKRAVVIGAGHYLPERIVENAEFEGKIDTSDEWIRSRSGIERRHFVGEGETTSTMATAAAKAALADAGKTAADVDAGEERLRQLETDVSAKREAFDVAAANLSAKRHGTAETLAAAVMAELPDLKLERAEFIVALTSDSDRPSASGIDEVEFHVRTNPGTRAGPMMKVASGGELSRFLLALKVALADRGSAPTLVFDEIDTGVGGAVADAIGRRLARLSKTVQVLAVTHAPQVAARAATHLLISKAAANGEDKVATRVMAIDMDARREEIARMLAGERVTDEARAAAAQLIGAQTP